MMESDKISLADPSGIGSALKLSSLPEEWTLRWPQSQASFSPGAVFFLRPAFVEDACKTLEMDRELEEVFLNAASAIARHMAMERLAWHCHWLLFCSGLEAHIHQWPSIPVEADAAGPMFYAVVLLSGLPYIRRVHRARGLDAEVTRQTLSDLELWVREHKRRHGFWGSLALGWLVHHFQGRLYAVGRLQYLPGRFFHPFRFFRHVGSGKMLALAEAGHLFRSDGQFASADGGAIRESLWLSRFETSDSLIRGNPVSPWGHVLKQEACLPAAEWVEVLRQGDPVMTVHIPATGPMEPAACGESFRQAVSFFEEYFPDWPFRAFTCYSWLLDPQFEIMQPPPTNIVAFLREWYLHPVERASGDGTFERVFDVFDGSSLEIDNAARRSSLQRAILDFIKSGGRCRCGGSVLFSEDLDWGKQVYRTVKNANL